MISTSLVDQERARRPGASDDECVRAVAAQIIEKLGIDEPPVDVEMVASMLGIQEVSQDPLLVEAGCLICDGGRVYVRVRQTDAPVRQRFTVCHECAHTFFPGFTRRTQYRCDPNMTNSRAGRRRVGPSVEQLCDLAASELLLPRRLFRADIDGAPFGLDELEALAERYEASLEATARRLVSVRREPTALVVLRPMQKPSERGTAAPERLRVVSSATSGTWPFIPAHKSTDPRSPFDRALLGEVVHEMALVDDIMGSPQRVEVAARVYPYRANGEIVPRVIALMRRPGGRL